MVGGKASTCTTYYHLTLELARIKSRGPGALSTPFYPSALCISCCHDPRLPVDLHIRHYPGWTEARCAVKALLSTNAAWGILDSAIASVTGLDESKYALYEPGIEQCSPPDQEVRIYRITRKASPHLRCHCSRLV